MLYSLLTELVQPLPLGFLTILGTGLVLWLRQPACRRALAWLLVPFLLVSTSCTPAVVYWLAGMLEWGYPPLAARPDDVQAIVVLAGNSQPPDAWHPQLRLGSGTVARCRSGVRLYYGSAPVTMLLSGGKVDPTLPGETLAEGMATFVRQLGVPDEDLLLETESRDTYENAVYSAAILRDRGIQRIALVTDATHLYRASHCFRRQGLEVVPVGGHYRASGDFSWRISQFVPQAQAAQDMQAVWREWLGVAWFWIRGRW